MYSVTNDETQTRSFPRVKWWPDLAILSIVCGLFLFSHIGAVSFLDPDEGMYGSIAREMAEEGDWITTHFNGVRYLNKPPLQFWLSGLAITAFGPSEWTVRLWSALPAFGTALLIWRLGVWLYGQHGGLLAAIIFVTSVGVFRYVSVTMTDFLLVFSLTLSIYGFLKALLSQQSMVNGQPSKVNRGSGWTIDHLRLTIYPVLFWLGMALGVLSKGLVGVIFPVMIVVIFLIVASGKLRHGQRSTVNGQWGWRRTIDDLRLTVWSPLGVLLFLTMTVPWHILAAWRNPGFFEFYILDNQILRFFNTRSFIEDDVPIGTLSFLIITLIIWFFPWSLSLPAALRQGFPRFQDKISLNEASRLLVGVWALSVLAFFSLSFSKLEHYSLPAIPALSLMVGGRWAEAFGSSRTSVNSQQSMVNGQWSIVNGRSSTGSRQPDGLKIWLGIGALGCVLVGAGVLFYSDLLTPEAFLAGFAELNVYYRILIDKGRPFPFDSLSPFVQLLKLLGVVLVVGVALSCLLLYWRFPKSSFITLVVVAGAIALLTFRLDQVVEPHHSARPVAEALLARSGPTDLIIHEGPLEYGGGLRFYTGRQIHVLNGRQGSLDFGSRFAEDRHLFIGNGQFTRLWKSNQRVFLVTGFQVRESALERLPSEKIFLVGRFGSRRLYTNQPLPNE